MKRLRQSGPIGCIAFAVYRFGHRVYGMNFPIIKKVLWIIYMLLDVVFVKAIANAELPADSKIDPSVIFVHGANGCIIGGATIGENTVVCLPPNNNWRYQWGQKGPYYWQQCFHWLRSKNSWTCDYWRQCKNRSRFSCIM